jgi:propionyl-CoA carboxylase alpha chain
MDIPIHYDPMIAKLIVHGKDREEALQRMIRAIDEYRITGIETTLSFCKFVMSHEAFVSGKFNTKFVEKHFKPEYLDEVPDDNVLEVAAALVAKAFSEKQNIATTRSGNETGTRRISSWKLRGR